MQDNEALKVPPGFPTIVDDLQLSGWLKQITTPSNELLGQYSAAGSNALYYQVGKKQICLLIPEISIRLYVARIYREALITLGFPLGM